MEKTNKQETCEATLNQPCCTQINTGQRYIVEFKPGSTLEVDFQNLSTRNPALIDVTIGSESQVPVNLQPSETKTKIYEIEKFTSISFLNQASVEDTLVQICAEKKNPGPPIELEYGSEIKLYMPSNAGYIISAIKGRIGNIGPEEYFPQFSTFEEGIKLRLIGGTGVIKDGYTVKIETTEVFVGEKRVLGAWRTPALYYYNGAYENQKWTIQKKDKSDGVIHYNDEVYLVNHAYEEQWLCIENSGRWLTTKKDAKVYWVIEG